MQYSSNRQIAEEKMEASSGTQLMRRDGGAGGPLVLAPVIGRYPCQECEARCKQQRKLEIAADAKRANCQAEEGSGGWDEEDFGPEAVDFRQERPCLRYRPAIPLPQDRN